MGFDLLTPPNPGAIEVFAAREVSRYLYLRTGLKLEPNRDVFDGEIWVASKALARSLPLPEDIAAAVEKLGPQDYLLRTKMPAHYIIGGSPAALLYAAYRFAHQLGVRFYLDGDVVPDAQLGNGFNVLEALELDETASPIFSLRGIQPFHDFPEGPDWWNTADYKAILAQLPKLRMNFIGLHTYPENRPAAEPTTWIGPPEEVNPDGTVQAAYPALWYTTALSSGWGFSAKNTGDYACGAGALYDRDDYGNDIMRGLAPMPDTPEECVELFDRAGAMFNDVFTFAKRLGITTCLGTETPLTVPKDVIARLPEQAPQARLLPTGGKPAHFTQEIEGTELDDLYRHVRYDLDAYTAAVPNGAYTVTLHFCEPHYDAAGKRVFGVQLEGQQVIQSLDVLAQAGKSTALVMPFENIAVNDGQLDIAFTRETELPCIAAIEVTGPDTALRVNCAGPAAGDFAADEGMASLSPEQIARLYEGIFTRIMRTHPLDYYWLWTPENWTWADISEAEANAAMADMRIAYDALARVGAPFKMATCGWVLGPQYNRSILDEMLPKDVAVSCINRAVGHDATEPGFANVADRGKWAIPWLEDDPAMTSLQLWAGRMRRDARLARDYGCTGLMGIHWRTRILGPNVAALADAGWSQDEWSPPAEGATDDKGRLPHWPVEDFYYDFAQANFGHAAAEDAGRILAAVDGKLPRPSDWIGGPGGYKPDERPWEDVAPGFAFVDEFETVREKVEGAGNLERFDYWLNNMKFLRATAKMKCGWFQFNVALKAAQAPTSSEAKKGLAELIALPKREELVKSTAEAYAILLDTVSTTGEMATVCNLEQHTFPGMLEKPAAELEALLGAPLPESAQLPRVYAGAPRIIVAAKPATVEKGAPVTVRAAVLDSAAPDIIRLRWRPLGEGDFFVAPMENTERQTYTGSFDPGNAFAVEYFIEAKTGGGEVVRWPATAPELNHSVVVMP